MPIDLKNCPCCGNFAQYSWWGPNGHDTQPKDRTHTVKCINEACQLETPHSWKKFTQAEARAIWNRRPRKKQGMMVRDLQTWGPARKPKKRR